jgi:hypothetical protein
VRFFSLPCVLCCSALSPAVRMSVCTRNDLRLLMMIRRALAGYDRSIVAPPSVLVQAASRCWIGALLTSFVVHEAADGHDDMLR